MGIEQAYLDSVGKQMAYYKQLGDKALAQIDDDKLFWQYNEDSNSIATIVKHIWGNMLSRWTDFLTTDGEKPWRDRDGEFDQTATTRAEVLAQWEVGWACFFAAFNALQPKDLETIIYIRNQGHTVAEAINRQLAHYPYHIGQIVFLAKMLATTAWQSLSIPKASSKEYNAEKFAVPKEKTHFTDEFLKK